MDKSRDFLKKNIDIDSTIVLACSGGSDSMCLLSLLIDESKKKNWKIIVAHVNHGLRKESDEEEAFVKKFCKDNDILLEVKRLEFENFNEAIGRRRRYEFFEQVAIKYKAGYLLTAHHGDDLIETVLMRLTRGSNLKGYMGILPVSQNDKYKILRPLLLVDKKDILDYLEEKKISYVKDNSNDSMSYTRNRYRKQVLPFLKEENSQVHEKYVQFSQELNDYFTFVEEYIKEKHFIVDNSIVINKIKLESEFIKRKCIEMLVREIQKEDVLDISKVQMKEILKMLDGKNRVIDLFGGYQCEVSYGILKLVKKEEVKKYKLPFVQDMELESGKLCFEKEEVGDTNYEIRLSSKDIVLPLWVRCKKDGDIMTIKGMNGHKKLSDIFINEKISKRMRDKIPVVTDSLDTILWLPGIKKSKFAKDKTEKYDIILKYEVKGKNECKIKTK